MKKSNNLTSEGQKPRILVAPLDWGLGHSTRCIPIVKELILQGCEVYIVADKRIFILLKKEFPTTVFIRYKGYEITYSYKKHLFAAKLIFQLPKIVLRIFLEKRWLKKAIKKYGISAVISDNRFGMHNKNIPSVYLTHQLYIKTGNRLTGQIAQKIHYYFIKKYSTCWVPDFEKEGIAGELSHPKRLPANINYIGPLSRFSALSKVKECYDLLIIISGPEPQRSIFENEILAQLKTMEEKIFLIRGLPGEEKKPGPFNNVTIENHLPADRLNEILAKSKLVLCRSGYTSVMDLSVLRKKAVLVATPGQTEQEYLSRYLLQKKFFLSMPQKDLSIKKALDTAAHFDFKTPQFDPGVYKQIIGDWVQTTTIKLFDTKA